MNYGNRGKIGSMKWMSPILVVLPLSLAAAAMESAPVNNSPWANNGPYVSPQQSPQVQSVIAQGTVLSIDTVFQHVTVNVDGGGARDFPIDSTTPITDHFAQINFQDLHPGDRVAVHFYNQPLLVTQVEKL